jgi:hypothetical protein
VPSHTETPVLDLFFVTLIVGSFALSLAYVVACEKL